MRRLLRYVLPVAFAAPAVFLVLPAHAAPASVTAPVTLGTESWFTFPDCPIAGICLPSMANSYPAGTLHVAVTAGAETARTYLALPADLVPAGSTVTGGDLQLPLDTTTTTPGNGSLVPETSLVEVCTTSSPIPAVSASTDTPPPVNCLGNATATIVGTPATALDVDLAPLAAELSQPTTTGLVLMAGDISNMSSTWHDVFSSDQRMSPPVAPPTMKVTYTPAEVAPSAAPSSEAAAVPVATATSAAPVVQPSAGQALPVHPVATTAAAPPAPVSVAIGIAGPLAPAVIPPAAAPAAPEVAPTPALAASAPAPVALGAGAVTLGGGGGAVTLASSSGPRIYDYPEVFFLPLILIAGFLGFGRQLTRPLSAPRQTPR